MDSWEEWSELANNHLNDTDVKDDVMCFSMCSTV